MLLAIKERFWRILRDANTESHQCKCYHYAPYY
jgi:hypothetical protein